jgi:hypothetical protein
MVQLLPAARSILTMCGLMSAILPFGPTAMPAPSSLTATAFTSVRRVTTRPGSQPSIGNTCHPIERW